MLIDALLLAAKVFMLVAVLPFIVLFAIAHAAITIYSLCHEVWKAWPK